MRLLLISSSTVHGHGYLDHAAADIERVLGGRKRVGFVPYALAGHIGYTVQLRERLAQMGADVTMIASPDDVHSVEAIFTGGGNTFRLLKALYDRKLLEPIRDAVRNGIPYIGTSAGTNIAAPTIKTTNDMPIVEPPSFNALAFVRYQINPHYLDADPSTTHMGETREERIFQFHEENDTPVVGLREGAQLLVEGGVTTLTGDRPARIFRRGKEPVEVEPGTMLDSYFD
ncbi:MAG: dipeptidase [Acidobacteriota bacterium]|jgi:dipeptidase E|nr:dipeptidase [Acidobacteriota bacterium]